MPSREQDPGSAALGSYSAPAIDDKVEFRPLLDQQVTA
jgi:hypothetical protein